MEKFLTDSQKQILKDNAFNVSANFLSGQVTNVIDSAMSTDTMKNVSNGLATGAGITAIGMSMISGEYFTQIQKVAEEVILYAVQQITVETANYVAKKVTELTVPDTGYISQVMNEKFNAEKTSLSEELKNMLESAESRQKAELDKAAKEEEEEKFKKIKQYASNIQKWLDEELPKITESVNEVVSKYLLVDPDELEMQIDTYIQKTKKELTQTIDEKVQVAYDYKKEREKELGEKAGKRLADEYNAVIKKQAQKQQNNITKVQAKAQQIIAATVQFAKLQIMALTGINIP